MAASAVFARLGMGWPSWIGEIIGPGGMGEACAVGTNLAGEYMGVLRVPLNVDGTGPAGRLEPNGAVRL